MTYEEAKNQLENSQLNIGDIFQKKVQNERGFEVLTFMIEEILIGAPDKWRKVKHEKYLMDNDNKKALENLNMLNKGLEVIFIYNPNGKLTTQTLTEHLKLIAF